MHASGVTIIKLRDMLLTAMKLDTGDRSGGRLDEAALERTRLVHSRRFVVDIIVVPLSRQTRANLKWALALVVLLHLMLAALWARGHFLYGL